jgi:hypothetical protein
VTPCCRRDRGPISPERSAIARRCSVGGGSAGQLHRGLHGDPDAPSDRNADHQPRRHRRRRQPATADTPLCVMGVLRRRGARGEIPVEDRPPARERGPRCQVLRQAGPYRAKFKGKKVLHAQPCAKSLGYTRVSPALPSAEAHDVRLIRSRGAAARHLMTEDGGTQAKSGMRDRKRAAESGNCAGCLTLHLPGTIVFAGQLSTA